LKQMVLAFLVATAILCPTVRAGGLPLVTVELYDLVFVSGGRVILGQIADLTGDPQTVNRLKPLQIGTLMKRKESRIVTAEEVKRAIPDEIVVSFTGSPAVEVLPAASTDQYCGVNSIIQRHFTALGGDSITAVAVCKDSTTNLNGAGAPPVRFRVTSAEMLIPGRQVFSIDRRDGDGEMERYHFQIEVQLYARLSFAMKHIARGQIIKPEDLTVRTVDLKTTGMAGLMYQPELAIGWEAARSITPDHPLRWDQIQPPAVVRKGEGISLVLGTKNMQIRASATALEAGSPGQKIWVRLEDNGKRLRATVVDGSCVMAE
jgi:flagella basal body P-ring formation protein FlgA